MICDSNVRERRLPKWAQDKLEEQRRRIAALEAEIVRQEAAHAVLSCRQWFTISGPTCGDDEVRKLWFLDRDRPFPACDLRKGDVLLVGRAGKDR